MLEGWVELGKRLLEGLFGDYIGFYMLVELFLYVYVDVMMMCFDLIY